MNELFRLAADSLLKTYGSEAVLFRHSLQSERVTVSPLFSAKIRREESVSKLLSADANVIISGCSSIPDVQHDRIRIKEKMWTILTAKEICPGIFELELKR